VTLEERLQGLRDAVEAADGHLPPGTVAPARTLLAKAGARTALGDATVVALAGSTGSGKSSLFNAVVGVQVSPPGVRRPTTGTAHAAVWSATQDRAALLDWLGAPRRHLVTSPARTLDGLVLLDLPDHDSTAVEHRLEVDRLVELVDVLVWVLDPQKYADAAVHDTYLRPYASHADVLVVVLNQVDRLDPAARAACLADLRGLLDREGLAAVPLLAVSARTGTGIAELRGELERRVSARRAASERLAADARSVARGLVRGSGTAHEVGAQERRALVDALADAAGVPAVVSAVEGSVRRTGTAATGWPVVRWTAGMRADPLRRLHLTGPADERGRTSLAAASSVSTARVGTALRQVRDVAGNELPPAWRDSLRRELDAREAALPERLDRAVAGTDLGAERVPGWWSVVGAAQTALLGVALVGVLWLLALVALGALQLDGVVPVPRVGAVPLPTALLVLGLLGGLLVALLSRPFVARTAARRGRQARARLLTSVAGVADTELLGPLADQRASHERFRAGLERASA
jgi:hypothetical protein